MCGHRHRCRTCPLWNCRDRYADRDWLDLHASSRHPFIPQSWTPRRLMDKPSLIPVLRVLSNELSLELLHTLATRSANVTAIADEMQLEVSSISHRLSILRKLGLVNFVQHDRRRHYSLTARCTFTTNSRTHDVTVPCANSEMLSYISRPDCGGGIWLASLLRPLGNATTLAVLSTLARHPSDVRSLARGLDQVQPRISQILQRLLSCGVVQCIPIHKRRVYELGRFVRSIEEGSAIEFYLPTFVATNNGIHGKQTAIRESLIDNSGREFSHGHRHPLHREFDEEAVTLNALKLRIVSATQPGQQIVTVSCERPPRDTEAEEGVKGSKH